MFQPSDSSLREALYEPTEKRAKFSSLAKEEQDLKSMPLAKKSKFLLEKLQNPLNLKRN